MIRRIENYHCVVQIEGTRVLNYVNPMGQNLHNWDLSLNAHT